jgi:predicted ATPase
MTTQEGILHVTVAGYKSISQEQGAEIRPLTILAGANSSGKSSIMQPLLLLKQTFEASYDPGSLLLSGPNVKFTSVDQLLSSIGKGKRTDAFHIGIQVRSGSVTTCFSRQPGRGLEIQQMTYAGDQEKTVFRLGMTHEEIASIVPSHLRDLPEVISEQEKVELNWVVVRNRCFLELALKAKDGRGPRVLFTGISPSTTVEPYVRQLIHLPGLRGNPERTYPVTAVGSTFPGTFEKYTASVIAQWQAEGNDDKLEQLSKDLKELGLTWKVVAKPVNDTQVELQVGRLARAARGGARDLVNIADVGFGVSQTLPVLVALHMARSGQLVYLEQPEIHLHPNAQFAMAQVLADAADRGSRIVVETHSALLLLGIQTLVAEARLAPEMVKLHWFKRIDGTTRIESADLDEAGTFGDWPEDFAGIALAAESRFLDAVEMHYRKN